MTTDISPDSPATHRDFLHLQNLVHHLTMMLVNLAEELGLDIEKIQDTADSDD